MTLYPFAGNNILYKNLSTKKLKYMKEYSRIIIITLLSLASIVSCKKNNTPKDYLASINSKTWWGSITYTGKAPEYYSVYFNSDYKFIMEPRIGRLCRAVDFKWKAVDDDVSLLCNKGRYFR